jgi:acyl dehydratase
VTGREAVVTEIRPVSRLDVQRFAVACGFSDPVHHEVAAARAAGYPDLLAPRYFFVSLGLSLGRTRLRLDLGAEGLPLDDDLSGRRVVAGETEIRWLSDIFAGDTITVTQRLVDVSRKAGRSGMLEMFKYERTYERDSHLVVHETFVRIAR